MAAVPISVLILTRNEELDLPGCLDSVAWSDDVHVFDSESTDRTAEIARARGAHVTARRFDSYSAQRNAALETLPFLHEWIFVLDADERPTPALVAEMGAAVSMAGKDIGGFLIRRRDYFLRTWLKHAQTTPFYIRLVRRGRARYVREINEVLEVDGRIVPLAQPFDHYPFSKGVSHWLTKHNQYSSMEARIVAAQASANDASWRQALFAKDFPARRVAQKALFYQMPGRPLIKWLYLMFVRGGVLDGQAGVVYSTLQAIYEYFIVVKTLELQRGAQP